MMVSWLGATLCSENSCPMGKKVSLITTPSNNCVLCWLKPSVWAYYLCFNNIHYVQSDVYKTIFTVAS